MGVTFGRRGVGKQAGKPHGPLFLVLGVAFASPGVWMIASAPDTDSTVTGTITRVVESRSDDGVVCSATADFVVDGQTHEARTSVRTGGMCDNSVGDPVEVRYAAADPTENEFGTRQSWFAWIFVLAGLVLGAVGAQSVRGRWLGPSVGAEQEVLGGGRSDGGADWPDDVRPRER